MGNPKEDNFSLSVFLYVFNEDLTKILLIKRNEEKRKKWGLDWGTIGGKVEPGEFSSEAGIREAKEEIGVDLKKKQLNFLSFEERPSKIHTPAVHFFYYLKLKEEIKIDLNDEADEYQWFDITQLPEKMFDSPKDIERIAKRAKEIFKK